MIGWCLLILICKYIENENNRVIVINEICHMNDQTSNYCNNKQSYNPKRTNKSIKSIKINLSNTSAVCHNFLVPNCNCT